MTQKEFNKLIKSPKQHIKKIDVVKINELKNQFPYCEIIHTFSLMKAHLLNDINFTNMLAVASIYSSNRKNLFYLIHPKTELKKESPTKKTSYLFEEWLKDPLLLKSKTNNKKNVEEEIKKSIKDNDYLTTETLAKIYVDQGHYKRAIQAYEILCLKYPKKSSFFANQIKQIKYKI